MKNIKAIALTLLICFFGSLYAAEQMNVYVEFNRFLNKDKQTILLLNYQVPYQNLTFLAQNNGYFAELKVNVKISEGDSLLLDHDINDIVGVRNKADTTNKLKSYLNRLSFTLNKPVYTILFSAQDVNSQRTFTRQFIVNALPENSLLSDIELNSEVRPDSTQYLAKFKRNNILYRCEPSILFNKSVTDTVYLYLEYYNWNASPESCLLNLSLEKDSLVVMDEYIDFKPHLGNESINLKIPLDELKSGLYKGSIVFQSADRNEVRDFEFAVVQEKEEEFFLFNNPDDEYALMKIFKGGKTPTDWKFLSNDKKRRYITQFWNEMSANTNLNMTAVMDMVQERIDYANKHFGHLREGWTSDRGRIYIRNGAPDDVQNDTSSDESRFVRKDYEIWKYTSGRKPVYMFVDIQMNGNYQLIYVENDDLESSNPNWTRYVGSDFDTTKLDN